MTPEQQREFMDLVNEVVHEAERHRSCAIGLAPNSSYHSSPSSTASPAPPSLRRDLGGIGSRWRWRSIVAPRTREN